MGSTVYLPQLGESVDGGTVIAWLVEVGDAITVDQAIAEVSTDKVDTEIPAPTTGTVTAVLAEVDEVVRVGQPILELDGGDAAGPLRVPDDEADGSGPTRSTEGAEVQPGTTDGVTNMAGPLSPLVKRLLRETEIDVATIEGTGATGRIVPDDVLAAFHRTRPRLSPLVKRLLRAGGLTADRVRGTGRDGRITPADVREATRVHTPAGSRAARDRASKASPTPGLTPPADGPPAPTAARSRRSGGRVERLTRSRRHISERMLASLQTTAQLTSAVEADVTRIMQVRAQVAPSYRARYGASISPLAFIARSVCRTLARHPALNASIDTEAGTATYHNGVDLGIAVDTSGGLIVPAIKDAETLTVVGLQRRISDVATRARDGKLTPDDMSGGTFTITNTGSRGSLFDTPILNPPEVGILATPTIEKRPVVVTDAAGNDTIAIRQRTYLCLTYDHRLVDGADAARFLGDLARDLDGDGWHREVAELG